DAYAGERVAMDEVDRPVEGIDEPPAARGAVTSGELLGDEVVVGEGRPDPGGDRALRRLVDQGHEVRGAGLLADLLRSLAPYEKAGGLLRGGQRDLQLTTPLVLRFLRHRRFAPPSRVRALL